MAVAARSLELPRSAPRLTVQVARDAAEMAWFAEVAHLCLGADSPKGPVGFLIGLDGVFRCL